MVATDLEVVTVTDTSVVITWTTIAPGHRDAAGRPLGIAADTELRIAPADTVGPARTVWSDATQTPYHYAEFHGLEPGRRYRFEAHSNGIRAQSGTHGISSRATAELTGRFTTLIPPPGRHLRTIALSNDIHYGERVSGLIVGTLPHGYHQDRFLPPYPEIMLDAMLDDLHSCDRAAETLLIAGDLTAEANPYDTRILRERLDRWGALGSDYFVTRGNHDRSEYGHDHWGENFLPGRTASSHDIGGLRVIGLDTSRADSPGGVIDAEQFAELQTQLRDDPERPTIVFGHHPVTHESAATNLGGPAFVLDRPGAAALQTLYRRAPEFSFTTAAIPTAIGAPARKSLRPSNSWR